MSQLERHHDPMRDWSALSQEARKYRAAVAIQERNHDDLWRLAQAHLLFMGKKGSRVSKHTLKMYRIATLELLEHWQGVDLLRPTKDDAQEYVRWLEQGVIGADGNVIIKPKMAATVNQRVVAVRNLYHALVWCGFEVDNPFDKVRIAKDPVKPHEKRQEYSFDVIKTLLDKADELGDTTTKVAIMLGCQDGLRVGEIVTLKWHHIDFHERLIRVTGKGNKVRVVPLGNALAKELSNLPRACDYVLCRSYRGVGPYTDESIRRRVNRLCVLAFGQDPMTGKGYAYKAVHSLRHTFGVTMHDKLGLLETQALLGHEDVATTARYSKVTSTRAAAKARGVLAELEQLTGQ